MRDIAILPSFVVFCCPHGGAGKTKYLVVLTTNFPLVVILAHGGGEGKSPIGSRQQKRTQQLLSSFVLISFSEVNIFGCKDTALLRFCAK